METVNTIVAIVAGVFGAGWGLQFLYYRYEKRKRGAESKTAELDADAKEDELRDAKLVRAYEQIEKLQIIVDREREKWVHIAQELTAVKKELIDANDAKELAEKDKCTVSGCINRVPPRAQKQDA